MISAPTLEYIKENPTGHTLESHIRKNFPDFYHHLETIYNFRPKKWSEKLYMYFNNIQNRPLCPICGQNPLPYYNWTLGYGETCSKKCGYKNPNRSEKIKQTNQERHGGIGFASDQTKQKIHNTCIERYGVENPGQLAEIKEKIKQTNQERHGGIGFASDQTKQKIHNTCIERYGVENPNKLPEINERIGSTCQTQYGGRGYGAPSINLKSQQTCIERYGVENPIKNPIIRNKFIKRMIGVYGTIYPRQIGLKERHPELISFNDSEWICKCPHPTCNKCDEKTYTTRCNIQTRRQVDGTELCTKLLPIGDARSGFEIGIQNILDELGIKYRTSVRDIISPLELDFYLPEHKIAIECNGIYWHSDIFKAAKYHLQKFERCEELGIQLISIWEDWWIRDSDRVKSFLESKLGVIKNKIYARCCEIKVLNKEHIIFLNRNHIQGACKSQHNLGLYYNGELVACMCFSKRSKLSGGKNDDCWELIRFANKAHTMVIGGASKLLKCFINQYNPEKIVSFSANDISNGALYKVLGFQKFSRNVSYWYIDPKMRRYHRSTFSKDNIIRKGLAPTPNKSEWTERIVMDGLKYYRIYDSGTTGWVYLIKKEGS